MSEPTTFTTNWEGRELKVEVGRLAQQTNASCVVTYGETTVLATVVMDTTSEVRQDFFPLTVDYEEKMYAAGRIKGSRFIKRENRPTDEAVLTGRLIDRSIRPLFDKKFKRPVQIVLTILSVDMENAPDVPALVAACTVLSMSDIPWSGPLGAVRIGKDADNWYINPTHKERAGCYMDLFVAGTGEKIIMIECGASEASEDDVFEGCKKAKQSLATLIKFIDDITSQVGKPKVNLIAQLTPEQKEDLEKVQATEKLVEELVNSKINEYLLADAKPTKALRKGTLRQMKTEIKEYLLLQEDVDETILNKALDSFYDVVEARVSDVILKEGKRVDGRKIDEIRSLVSMVSLIPRVHGSGLFQRGETQVMSIVTLGSPGDEQTIDGMEEETTKRYMHHYNFPGYSVGEVKMSRGASRRDIGHGSLAEKALKPMIPSKEDFPYTVRVVSETLGSNGSSSMGAVCGSTLSLMDAGVPIKRPVAGIAMGLASNEAGDWRVFTDLQDLEDSQGGMDFKVAGTTDGITAIQLDTKTHGLNDDIIRQALDMAKVARGQIIDVIKQAIEQPRPELSKYAPRIEIVQIKQERIKNLIGPGGKVVKGIIEETGVDIDIEQDGRVYIISNDAESMKQALEKVTMYTKEIEVGQIYEAKVVKVTDFGAFVALTPFQDGLLHVSEIDHHRVSNVADVMKVGDVVKVKVQAIDPAGKVNVSAKELIPRPEGMPERSERPSRPPSRDYNNNRSGGGDRRPPRPSNR